MSVIVKTVNQEVLDKICAYLDCQISDVIEYKADQKNPEE